MNFRYKCGHSNCWCWSKEIQKMQQLPMILHFVEVFTVINSMITLIKSQVQKNTSDVYCFLVL